MRGAERLFAQPLSTAAPDRDRACSACRSPGTPAPRNLAWVVAGALTGAAFYRWQAGGLLSLPFGVALVALGESAIGGNLRLPFFGSILDFELTPSVTTALGTGLACLLLGLAMTWPLIRDVPLRNRVS
ncbi:hypothetical protein [Streptosporangium sp. H16]|uniref:hypothetical protein n=1 Tax=Streptosporangium sp. H16 TaxID=3444184 RepID=UPI003F79F9B0